MIGFRKQDTLVCILYCNSPVLRSIRTPLSPWGLCGMMSYLPISKGLNGSLPSLPYHIPKRQSCGCQQRIAQLLLQHTEGRWEKPSLWNRNKRQLGFKAGGGGVVKWEGTAGCFQASPSPPLGSGDTQATPALGVGQLSKSEDGGVGGGRAQRYR